MKNIMICKNKERETMCFRGFLERLLNIPFSEKQNISVVQNGPQIPNLFRIMGYSYNGHYSGLLIRQIRVRIPGSPLTPHRTNGSGRHILSVEIRVRLPLG